ncbi:MAG: hypothetical protein UY23_C0001G0001, partial [Candidatus Jorgensenbacteria bacterium GW2011_GWA1_48_11]
MTALFLIILIVAAVGAFYFFWRQARRKRFLSELQLKLFLIRLPRGKREGREIKQEINVSEQLFSTLAAFKKPFVLEAAVPYVGEEIHFYAAVPDYLGEALSRQIQSLWPDGQVEPAEDYNVFNSSGRAGGAFVGQRDRFVLPVRTYEEVNADTFLPILGGLAKINEVGEGGALQVVARPAKPRVKKEIRSALQNLKKGWKLKDVLNTNFSVSVSDITEAFQTKDKKDGETEKVLDEEAIKAVGNKLSKPLFEVNVRIVTSGPSQYQADSILEGILAGFSQFAAPNRNEFKVVRPKNLQNLVHNFSFRRFVDEEAMVLTSGELASLFHLPTVFTEMPKIKAPKAKEAPPPADLAGDGVLIGESVYRGQIKEIRITDDDRRRHAYMIGQTGTGKSNLLTNMALDDIKRGKGVAVLDPHGDFIEDILGLIPERRVGDVIIFDPSDLNRPLGLNMIEYDPNRPEEKTFIVNEMQSIFNKLFAQETMGPMFEQYMRNALLLLMEDAANEPATLMEVARVFTDPAFRARKLARVRNPAVV